MAKTSVRIEALLVVPLEIAKRDARKFLNDGQYLHALGLVKRLADFGQPNAIQDLRIEQVENIWELKDKGGLLGKINIRIFFAHLPTRREIVILGAINKNIEGKTPTHVIMKMQNRLDSYVGTVA